LAPYGAPALTRYQRDTVLTDRCIFNSSKKNARWSTHGYICLDYRGRWIGDFLKEANNFEKKKQMPLYPHP